MKVITGCAACVVGHSVFVEHPIYKIPEDGTDAERLGAFAAKGCYDSYGVDGRSCIDNHLKIRFHHSYFSVCGYILWYAIIDSRQMEILKVRWR